MADISNAVYVLIDRHNYYPHAASMSWEVIRGMTDNLVFAALRHGANANYLVKVFDNESGKPLGEYIVEVKNEDVSRVLNQYKQTKTI